MDKGPLNGCVCVCLIVRPKMVVNGTSVNAPGLINVFDFHRRQRATASHHL